MKKLMLAVAMFIMMGIAQVAVAQEANPTKVEVIREGNTFIPIKQEKKKAEPIKTKHYYRYKDGNDYPVFIGTRGGCYIVVPDKNGGEKNWYIDEDTANTIRKEMGVEKKPKSTK